MRLLARMTIVLAVAAFGAAGWCQGVKVFGTDYFADTPFPQFMNMWHEGFALSQGQEYLLQKDAPGAYVFVHFENIGSKPVKVADVAVEGVKLSEGLGRTNDAIHDLYGHSISKSKLPAEQIDKLRSAGEPMWWKAEPRTVPAKGVGQIVIRLRRQPKADALKIEIRTDGGTAEASVSTKNENPRFAGFHFSPELDTVYAYLRHPSGKGIKPDRLFMDGKNVTQLARLGSDESVDVVPVVIKLPKPLEAMSYHCLRVGYPDGTAATAGICAWGNELVYGIWGSKGDARDAYKDWAAHNFNVHMGHGTKATEEMSLDPSGHEFLKSLGFRNMVRPGNARNPIFFFLQDEPDAQDYGIDDVPVADRLGLLGQALVEKAEEWRAKDPTTPILLNIDNTYKPENWYMYHQLTDIPCIDPYYQGEIDLTYTKRPGRFAAFTKPTYVLAASSISQSSCQPKPLHVILCSTRYVDPKPAPGAYSGRFPTPEEKRLEVYYAIGAGAKGISYWWFTPSGDCSGMGSDVAPAQALYREVGLLGAEVRTAGPVITTSCPAGLTLKTPRLLTARSLLCGLDSDAVILNNENVLCDRAGTVYKPIEKVNVTAQSPSWLTPTDVFEVTYEGIKDVSWKLDGSQVALDVGTVDLSRFIVVTSDSSLRGLLKSLYDAKFASNVAALRGTK